SVRPVSVHATTPASSATWASQASGVPKSELDSRGRLIGGLCVPRRPIVKAVYSELHRSHDPQFFLVRGLVRRTTEQPERADRLLAGLKSGKHDLIAPVNFGQAARARVHSAEYLNFLAEAWDAWSALADAGPEMIANIHPVRHAASYPTHIV